MKKKERFLLVFIVLVHNEYTSLLPSVQAYSKVSFYNQARSGSQNVAFTVSPIFAASQRTTIDLRPGEVIDHPKYSTLDEQQVSQLDASAARKNPQKRFHPPANFEHTLSHVKAIRQQQLSLNPLPVASAPKDVMYSKPVVSMTYDYAPANFDVNARPKPSAKPTLVKAAFPPYAPGILDAYPAKKPSGNGKQPQEQIIYDAKPSALDYSDHYSGYDGASDHHLPLYEQSPYHVVDDGHDGSDDIIYEHVPDDHHYHHYQRPKPISTTMLPEPMDQRLNKRPYSYYYIGKKLWYVPLYFSIYFIIYIAALVLKSVARHKINFPAQLAAAAASNGARSTGVAEAPGWIDYAVTALDAIESYKRQ